MICIGCGAAMEDDSEYCPECGKKVHEGSEPAMSESPVMLPQELYPENMKPRWIVLTSLVAALLIDVFLLRHDRGINIIISGVGIGMIWLLPVVKHKKLTSAVVCSGLLFAAATIALAIQASGPADKIFYPIWIGTILYFGLKSRNALLGLENVALNKLSERKKGINAKTIYRESVLSGLEGGHRKTADWLIGIIVAVPIATVVLILLAQADVAFGKSIERIWKSMDELPSHIFWCCAIALVLVVWSCVLALARERDNGAAKNEKTNFPIISSQIVMIVLAAIIGCFLYVHLRTLLMNEQEILKITGLHFYQYIRRGFAELIVVEIIIGLVLVFVLHSNQWVSEAKVMNRVTAWVTILLTAGINVSCAARLWYYVAEYELTIVRSENAAGIVVSFISLAYLAYLVSKPQTFNRTVGFIAQIFLIVYVAWMCTMPVRTIAHYNAKNYISGHRVQISYLPYLGPDAYPDYSEILIFAKPYSQASVLCYEDTREWDDSELKRLKEMKWFEWNPSHMAAEEALETIGRDIDKECIYYKKNIFPDTRPQ